MLNYCTIPLTRGKVALVDAADFPRVSQYTWYAKQHYRSKHLWYAYRGVQVDYVKHYIALHRFILDAPPGVHVDHINGDGFDNRRSNLRFANQKQNGANQRKPVAKPSGYSSRFKGVTWRKREEKWVAQIKVDYRNHWLGYFNTEEDAARAYNDAALDHWGEFAQLNSLPPTVPAVALLT